MQGIPRQAVLKPSHAKYRLQNQRFALGDRVIMVQDSGGVPLCAKGVVVGLNDNSIDVIWDVPFLSGTDLNGRCSQYRGSTCQLNACLNLTHPQYVMSTRPEVRLNPETLPPQPQLGPRPYLNSRGGASGFRPAVQPNRPIQIMTNPHRGRGSPSHTTPSVTYGAALNGRGQGRGGINGHVDHLRSTINRGLPSNPPASSVHTGTAVHVSTATSVSSTSPAATGSINAQGGVDQPYTRGGMINAGSNVRGGANFRGGGFRGRGGRAGPPSRGFRGRGRGGPASPAVQS